MDTIEQYMVYETTDGIQHRDYHNALQHEIRISQAWFLEDMLDKRGINAALTPLLEIVDAWSAITENLNKISLDIRKVHNEKFKDLI